MTPDRSGRAVYLPNPTIECVRQGSGCSPTQHMRNSVKVLAVIGFFTVSTVPHLYHLSPTPISNLHRTLPPHTLFRTASTTLGAGAHHSPVRLRGVDWREHLRESDWRADPHLRPVGNREVRD